MANIKTTDALIVKLLKDFTSIYKYVKELAPQNSSYIGLDNFKPSNYIFVNNKRVYTNSGKLKNSVIESVTKKGVNIVHEIYVPASSIDYYEKAVLSPTLTRTKHFGRIDYGTVRYYGGQKWYENSRDEVVENRNYLYYMKGESFARSVINKYNGMKIYVEDDIRRWQNGV